MSTRGLYTCAARLATALLPVLWPALLCFSSGCGYVRVTMTTENITNNGRPLQVLVRAVDEQTYRQDSYSVVSQQVIRPDQSVLRKLVIEPRQKGKKSFCVKPGKGKGMAVYALYTSPIGPWKMLFLPSLPLMVTIPLGRRGIKVEEVKERRLGGSGDSEAPNPPPPSNNQSSDSQLPSLPQMPTTPTMPTMPSAPTAPTVTAPTAPTAPTVTAPTAPTPPSISN